MSNRGGMMKRNFTLTLSGLVLAVTVGTSTSAQAQNWPPKRPEAYGPKRTVTIAPFEIKVAQTQPTGASLGVGFGTSSAATSQSVGTISVPNTAEFGTGLAEVATTVFTETTAFSVIDPLNDPNAVSGGSTAPASATSQYLLKATITDISCRQRAAGIAIGIFGGGQGRFDNRVTIDVRLVDPVTGAVIESIKATGSKQSKGSIFGLKKYEGGSSWDPGTKVLDLTYQDFESSSLGEACRLAVQDAATKLMARVAKRSWEASVLKIVEAHDILDVYLNLPGDCGLKVGDRLELCVAGEELTDPKTGKVVGRTKATVLGVIEVASIDNDTILCAAPKTLASSASSTQPMLVRLAKT